MESFKSKAGRVRSFDRLRMPQKTLKKKNKEGFRLKESGSTKYIERYHLSTDTPKRISALTSQESL